MQQILPYHPKGNQKNTEQLIDMYYMLCIVLEYKNTMRIPIPHMACLVYAENMQFTS